MQHLAGMKDVQQWIQGPKHYRVGVMLYLKYGTNDLFKRALTTEEETSYKRKRLEKELSALCVSKEQVTLTAKTVLDKQEKKPQPEIKKQNIKSTPAEPSSDQTANHQPRQWPRSACRDDYEVTLWEKAALLLKEIAALHAYLSTAQSDFERRMYAFELLRKDDELDKVYDNRKAYRTDCVKESTTDDIEYVTDPYLMAKRLDNLKRYIRREKGNLEKHGETVDRRERLDMYVKEYNYYAGKMEKPLKDA